MLEINGRMIDGAFDHSPLPMLEIPKVTLMYVVDVVRYMFRGPEEFFVTGVFSSKLIKVASVGRWR